MKLVWNGCDGYIETEDDIFYHGAHEHHAFDVVPSTIDDVPCHDDGEPDFSGDVFFMTTAGKVYRKVQS